MLTAKIDKSPVKAAVALKGVLDEEAAPVLSGLLGKLRRLHVVFDCLGVTAVNSVGFRQWTSFLKALGETCTFDFVNCPQAFLDYAGLLVKTAYADRIASFQVPFRCESCGEESIRIFETDAVEPDDDFKPGICPSCNGVSSALATPADCVAFKRQ